jgi:hypothetical protein
MFPGQNLSPHGELRFDSFSSHNSIIAYSNLIILILEQTHRGDRDFPIVLALVVNYTRIIILGQCLLFLFFGAFPLDSFTTVLTVTK